jgi:hypothetical protein
MIARTGMEIPRAIIACFWSPILILLSSSRIVRPECSDFRPGADLGHGGHRGPPLPISIPLDH